MDIIVSIIPSLLFILFLYFLDSFKLVIKVILLFAIIWGLGSAIMAYFANTFVLERTGIGFHTFSKYVAPAIEEFIKALFIFLLIYKKRVGFMIDAAIYGFAVGAGFALLENILFIRTMADSNLLIWIIRGFGTAIMHGGCTSLLAIILISGKNRDQAPAITLTLAFSTTYIIHSAFNHFYIDPVIQTIGILLVTPVLFILIFRYTENQLQDWLEIEFASEIELLNMINKGQLMSTRSGEYLASLKSRFSGETILDMYCFLAIYLELSIKAKRNVMLKESGFPVIIEEDIQAKLIELAQLRKRIGKVGELTLSPLISMNYRNLWKLNFLQ
jgi:RsiW-degrading membrane proteinase PrsW (M82 family)